MVAELFLGLKIEKDDVAALVYNHHCVGSRFQEPAVFALYLRQALFVSLARADVADRRGHEGSFRAVQRAQHDLDRKLAAVLSQPDELNSRADLLRQRVFRGAQIVRDQPFREAHGNDVRDFLPDELVAAIAELLLRLNVQQHDFAALVHHHHRIRSRLQQPAVFRV